jgi:hypothetical protein
MGEQPNPWEVLPPQDATSRHRAISAVSGGADYLSTLHLIGARGRRLIATTDFIRARMRIAISPLVCRADQSLQGHAEDVFDRLPTVLPSLVNERSGSTVISRFRLMMFPSSHPNLRCQTTPSL